MNNEIKEILKILKKCEFGACITKHNSRTLLDYITNLQNENERLKQTQYVWSYDLDMQLEDYKSRCKKAIKCIKDKYYKEEYERKGAFTNKLMGILQGEDNE